MAINPRTIAAGALCALLAIAPAPAAARVTISVEVAYGGVVACGVGIFIAFSGTWDVAHADHLLQGALVEFSQGRAHLGLPAPSMGPVTDASAQQLPHDLLQLELLRWRF